MDGESPSGAADGTGLDPGQGEIGDVIGFEVVEHGPDARVVRVRGEVDTLTAPLLRDQLDAQAASALLVLDLSAVSFLGSAGLAALVAAKDTAGRRGHRLRLVCGSRTVTRALQATGLLTLFDIAEDVPEALRAAG